MDMESFTSQDLNSTLDLEYGTWKNTTLNSCPPGADPSTFLESKFASSKFAQVGFHPRSPQRSGVTCSSPNPSPKVSKAVEKPKGRKRTFSRTKEPPQTPASPTLRDQSMSRMATVGTPGTAEWEMSVSRMATPGTSATERDRDMSNLESTRVADTTMVELLNETPVTRKRVVKKAKRRIDPKNIEPVTPKTPRLSVKSNSIAPVTPLADRTLSSGPKVTRRVAKANVATPRARDSRARVEKGSDGSGPRKIMPRSHSGIRPVPKTPSMPILPLTKLPKKMLEEERNRRPKVSKGSLDKKNCQDPQDEVYDYEFFLKR